ncbi:hypothetical protein J6590_056344 [Homalodisca vitripennis]|nr:hypothetical protein J6590_056344 [Homalodisca vitripennis]
MALRSGRRTVQPSPDIEPRPEMWKLEAAGGATVADYRDSPAGKAKVVYLWRALTQTGGGRYQLSGVREAARDHPTRPSLPFTIHCCHNLSPRPRSLSSVRHSSFVYCRPVSASFREESLCHFVSKTKQIFSSLVVLGYC